MVVVQPHTRIGDPHVTSDDANRLSILRSIFEPLVRRGPGGSIRPCLADRWTVSPDARTWTFRLRGDAYFHDGKRLEAEDVVCSLNRIRSGRTGGELGTSGVMQSYLTGSTLRSIGTGQVSLTTPEPMADLADLLVDIPILSAEAVRALPESLVGTGPYALEAEGADFVAIRRSNAWWGPSRGPREVHWRAVEGADERLEMLLSGRADIARFLDPAAALDRACEAFRVPTSVCAAFMCNLRAGPCTSRDVRRALNYALDKKDLIGRRDALPSAGPLTPLSLGYDPGVEGFAYDPMRARRILSDSGFSSGLTVTLDVPTELPDGAPELARKMARYWEDVGVGTRVVVHEDRPAYAETVRANKIHDAACFDSSPASTFRVFREKFHSGVRGPWWLGYHNADVNRLIDEARATVDTAARRRVYRRAYGILSADAPWIFLFNPARTMGVRRGLKGWRNSPEGHLTFD